MAAYRDWMEPVAIFLVTFVLLVDGDLFRGSLNLKKQFDTFDGGHSCFGNSGGHTTGDEIFGEGHRISGFGHLCCD